MTARRCAHGRAQALYDCDVFTEEAVIKWSKDQPSNPQGSGADYTSMIKKASTFVDSLLNASEEEDD